MTCPKCNKEIPDISAYCLHCGKKLGSDPRPKPMKRANGMGNVTKLSGRRKKPWRARMTVNGKPVIIGDYERKTDAYMALEKMLNAGGPPQFYNCTLEGARELWMEKHYPQITKSGIDSYEAAWKYFDPIKKMKIAELKTTHFQRIIDAAADLGRSRSTCEKIKQLASQLCKWAMENDLINKNYAAFTEIKATKSEPREPFTKAELQRLWEFYKETNSRDAGTVLLLCHTGLRPNELLSMKKTDFYNDCLHGGSKTEKGMNRSVPVPDIMRPVLDHIMETESEYIICSSAGGKLREDNWRKRNYYPMLEAAGFTESERKKRSPYSCRHTYATMCARAKMDDKALQDILGHEDISTTRNVYTHTDEEYLKQAAKHLDFIS